MCSLYCINISGNINGNILLYAPGIQKVSRVEVFMGQVTSEEPRPDQQDPDWTGSKDTHPNWFSA